MTDTFTIQIIRKGKGQPQNLMASYEVESELPFAEAYYKCLQKFTKEKAIPEFKPR